MTDVVVSNNTGNILANTDTTTNITTVQADSLVISDQHNSIITLGTIDSVLVENTSASIILAGALGPQGVAGISEDDVMYSKRIDFTTDSTLYRGEAVVGSSENSNTWRIRYIVIGNDGDVSETWASGNANFDKVWADRALLSYS